MKYTALIICLVVGCGGASTGPMTAPEACLHFDGCRQMESVFAASLRCEIFFADWPEECLQAMAWSPCDTIGWARDCHPDCAEGAATACVGDMLFSCSGSFLMEFDSIDCCGGGCCKICNPPDGCACGDSCISCSKNCTKGEGCACNSYCH